MKRRQAIEALLEKLAKRITPTAEEAEKEKKFADWLAHKLSKALDVEASLYLAGSTARDTGLRGDKDLDLFVAYPKTRSRDYVVDKTIKAVKKAVPARWVMHYAEHPYLQARVRGFKVEVIPCFKHAPHEQLKSAVDRSPLHMDYLQKRLTPRQRRDVRCLKQFLKNAKIYGAELRVQGFSGLLCEYLVLNYRSFYGLVEAAKDWRPQEFIDIEGYYPSRKHSFKEPLVLVDAIDKNRNAAAVVSSESFAKFVALCNAFWQKPSNKFFFAPSRVFTKRQLLKTFRARGTSLLCLRFKRPAIVEDVLYPQLEKTAHSFRRQLELKGFLVFDSHYFCAAKSCFLLYEFYSLDKPDLQRLRGPFAFDSKAVARFLKAHRTRLRGPFVEGDRVFLEKVDAARAADFLKTLLRKGTGVASHLKAPLRGARFVKNESVFNASGDALQELGNYLFKKEFWW